MRHDVFVSFDPRDDIALHTDQPMTLDEARVWLDGEFARLGCESARPSGKVLFVDKVLGIAQAAGAAGFADAAWATAFTRATAGALRRTLVRVDVPNTTVGF
jgi:DNA-binding FadR family transcriptional regulator